MTEENETIIDTAAIADHFAARKRLRRKLDILRLDAKSQGKDQLRHDIGECLALLDIIERTQQ
jgi:hypothetical protein